MTSSFSKDPDARLNYGIDWAAWLSEDTIAESVWIVPAGLTSDGDSSTVTATSVVLAGGTAGQQYRVTNRVTTGEGLIDDRSITIFVLER